MVCGTRSVRKGSNLTRAAHSSSFSFHSVHHVRDHAQYSNREHFKRHFFCNFDILQRIVLGFADYSVNIRVNVKRYRTNEFTVSNLLWAISCFVRDKIYT